MAKVFKITLPNSKKYFSAYKNIIEHSIPGAIFHSHTFENITHLLEIPDYFTDKYSYSTNKIDEGRLLFDIEKMVFNHLRKEGF
jgi:hypothetical protein